MNKMTSKLIKSIPKNVNDANFDKIADMISDYKLTTKEEVNRVVKRALSGKDIEKPSKKNIKGGAIQKPKKTIDVDEEGVLTPKGFTKEEKDIIRQIDYILYSTETVIQIMKDIAKDKIKSSNDFPEPEFPKKGTHRGEREGSGKKKD